MNTLIWFLGLAYFMLPAYAANMSPLLSRCFKFNLPLDFNIKLHGRRLLGSHKTVLGSFFGILSAVIITFVQRIIFVKTGFGLVDYSDWLIVGLLLGNGAILGDALKSFFKRRINILPGQPWIPFDEIDFSVGALLFVSLIYFPGWTESFWIVIVSTLGHIVVNHCAFYLRIRKEKW